MSFASKTPFAWRSSVAWKSAVALAVASVVSATAVNAASTKVGDVTLRLNGSASLVGASIDQSNNEGLDDAALAIDTALTGSASTIVDGDLELGVRATLDLDYTTNFDSSFNDAGDSSILNELWLYADGTFGRVQLGQQDGAARVMGFRPPSISSSMRVDNPEIFLLGYPCRDFCGDDPQQPGTLFSPNGMQLRTDVHSSDVYLKISYYTPRYKGFQVGVSFTPDGSRNLGDVFGGDDVRNKQSNIWDLAANYRGRLGDNVDLGVSVGYVTGENERNDSPGFFDDVRDFGAGVNLGYREWTFGAAYRSTNVAGAGPIEHGFFLSNVLDGEDTTAWSVGLRYDRGPWAAGVNYIDMAENMPFGDPDQEGSGLDISGAYTFTENIRLAAGYQHFEFEGPSGTCQTDFGGPYSCSTLDGNIAYLESRFSF